MGKTLVSRIKTRKPKIVNKHINEKNVLGWAYQEDFEIEIDPRQDAREYLNTLIHEMLHCFLPDASERTIIKLADIMTEKIWRRRYRRMEK
jgi:hypothetical protein